MKSFMKTLQSWNTSTSERAKLQHIYLFVIVTFTIIAGLISLFNALVGRLIISAVGLVLAAFLVNWLTWAIARVYLLDHIERKAPTKTKK